jgi:predicted ATP-binding protein involved in virulence
MQNLQVRLRSICIQNYACLDFYDIKPKGKRIEISTSHHAVLHSINNSLNKATHFLKIYYRTEKKRGSYIKRR